MRATAICTVLVLVAACSDGGVPTTGTAAATPSTTPTTVTPSTTVPVTMVAETTSPATTDGATTVPPATSVDTVPPTTTAPEVVVQSAFPLTRELSDDLLTGRDNGTLGSALALEILVAELSSFAEPLAGFDTFEHPFDAGPASGTNVVGLVPGTDLADEFVMVGGHYDHLGDDCRFPTVDDVVCNGAADNAAGVAIAVEAVRAIASTNPRRSIVIALWDSEEDGLVGSRSFAVDLPLPVEQIVAYVNLDLLGVSLLPSLDRHTLVIGAESGGPALRDLAAGAVTEAGLVPVSLGVVFGQGRSDHAPFADAGIPVVFFSDSTNGCYHTVDDEIDRIDQAKLDRELAAVTATLAAIADGEVAPQAGTRTPLVSFDDVVALHELVTAGEPDLDLLGAVAPDVEAFLDELDRILDDGPAELDATDSTVVLDGAAMLIGALAAQDCPA